MPEAIATTKRKFYKALESLNQTTAAANGDRNSLTSVRPTSQPVVKRVRRSTSNGSTIGQPLQVTYLPRPSADEPSKDGSPTGRSDALPNFSPWSHDAFLTRLKTFSNVSLWHPKPEPVSEVAWAKRGWTCIEINTVACRGGCDKRVVVDFAPISRHGNKDEENDVADIDGGEEETFESSLIARYEDLIVSGHGSGCLWRRSGCQDDIYHLQVVRPAVWQPALAQRYTSVMNVNNAMQDVAIRGLPPASISSPNLGSIPLSLDQLLSDLPSTVLPTPLDASHESKRKALEIALHGWEGSSASGNDLLSCGACFQRVGLWMYQPGYKSLHRVPSEASGTGSHNSNNDEDEDDGGMVIDLLEMHREHCPWRNAHSQRASGSLHGLNAAQILRRVVTTYAREQRRRSEEERGRVSGDHQVPAFVTSQDANDDDDGSVVTSPLSKEAIALQDKQRESRLRKLKNLFRVKRREPTKDTRNVTASTVRPNSLISK